MSDFFKRVEEQEKKEVMNNENTQEPVVETIKLGDREYTQDELNKLVSLGESAKQFESKFNTPLNSLASAYGRSQSELKEAKDRLASLEQRQQEAPTQANADQVADARRILKEQFGVITRDEFETEFRNRYQVERQAERLNDQIDDLAIEIDGTDGRPRFDAMDILSHMKETGIKDPMKAYKDKYESQLEQWREKNLSEAKPMGLLTQDASTAGAKQPERIKVDRSNLTALLKEHIRER